MVHHSHHHDDGGDQPPGPDQDQGDAPDAEPLRGRLPEGTVEAGWLRPNTHRGLGRPRVSTIILLIAWIGVLVLYIEVRPG